MIGQAHRRYEYTAHEVELVYLKAAAKAAHERKDYVERNRLCKEHDRIVLEEISRMNLTSAPQQV